MIDRCFVSRCLGSVPLLLAACAPTTAEIGDTDVKPDVTAEDTDSDEPEDTSVEDTAIPDGWPFTYIIDVKNGTFVKPVGIGSLIANYIDRFALLGTSDPFGQQIKMIVAMSDTAMPPQQDLCNVSLEVPPVDYSDRPHFTAVAPQLAFTANGYDVVLSDVTMDGRFEAPDAERIIQLSLEGTIDTRPLDPMLGSLGAVCDFLVLFGATCVACPDGQPYCVEARVEDLTANLVPGPEVVEVTEADVAANPNCVP